MPSDDLLTRLDVAAFNEGQLFGINPADTLSAKAAAEIRRLESALADARKELDLTRAAIRTAPPHVRLSGGTQK